MWFGEKGAPRGQRQYFGHGSYRCYCSKMVPVVYEVNSGDSGHGGDAVRRDMNIVQTRFADVPFLETLGGVACSSPGISDSARGWQWASPRRLISLLATTHVYTSGGELAWIAIRCFNFFLSTVDDKASAANFGVPRYPCG